MDFRFRLLLISFFFFAIFKASGQIDLGEDVTVNAGIPVKLNAEFTGTYGTMVEAWDDAFEGKFAIGFPFTFYGETFDSISLSPNAVLSFDDNPATYYFQMIPIPNAIFTKAIMGPYQDLFTRPMDSPHSTHIYYGIIGDAPDRKFVAGWCEAPMYSCSDKAISSQIVLEESTNEIYNHIFQKPECQTSQGNRATQGLNYDITLGTAVAGRNKESWTAEKESWQFVPQTSTSYDVDEIDFEPDWVFPEHSVSFAWYEGSVVEENRLTEDWSVVVAPMQTTTYFGVLSVCGGVQFVKEITVNVIPMPTAFNPNSNSTENRTFGFHSKSENEIGNFTFQIFNRWGVRVFETASPNEKWDGKASGIACATDVYTWVVRFEFNGESIENVGTVTLVR